jgi:hypothetical protein
MPIPQLLTTEDVATALKRSVSCLEKWRADGVGPNFIRLEGSIFYLEEDVVEYLRGARQLQDPSAPVSPQAMRAAALHGLKDVSQTFKARREELAAADKPVEDEVDKYAVTVTRVGEPPNSQIEHINLCKPQPVVEPASPHLLNR